MCIRDRVNRNVKAGRLHFTTSLESCLNEVDVVFSAVGTPPDEDGSADLSYVLEVARTIGRNMQKYILVVTKSTVPVGTAKKVRAAIQEELDKRGVSIQFDVASNPEFLKEGNAINDFMSPDRVVAVSYTHLDVYKRQLLHIAARCSAKCVIYGKIPQIKIKKSLRQKLKNYRK